MKKYDWSKNKEHLTLIVSQSKTFTEVLQKLGLSGGRNTDTLKKYIDKFCIDISHFDPNVNARKFKIIWSDDELFVENCKIPRATIKRRVIEKQLIAYICDECGISDTYNSKPIVLQLEHKNGNSRDNRLENLCFLCPNCHSQTDSYAGRNNKKCTTKRQTKFESRKVDWDLVYREYITLCNYCAVARKFNISNTTVKKIVKNYEKLSINIDN